MGIKKITAANVLINSLEKLGIEHIYGVVGDSLNGITNALRSKKNMRWLHVRHEEAAAFAAGAEAQLTGKLAVCAGSCGPGNLHLINGLYDCNRSHAPVLAIAAHIPSAEIGSNYFQETHPQFLFKECSVFCELVSDAEQMPRMLGMAIQAALNQNGVAVLVIPGDVALKEANSTSLATWPRAYKPEIIPNSDEITKIAKLLNKSHKVTLLCGSGCMEARDELMQLAEILKSPMVHALRGKSFLEYDNPYDVGMTGFVGFASGYYAMEDCDTLLMLGTDFPYRSFYPSKATIIQVDIKGENIGRRYPVDFGAVGDIKLTIQALLPALKSKPNDFLNKARAHYQKSRSELDKLAQKTTKPPIHPQYLASLVSKFASEDAIFACDVGTPTVWSARYLKMNGKRRLLGSFNHGSMANAMLQCIGAQIAYPNRQVIALCGDGGFGMMMGEILTLRQLHLPIKIIIFNNSSLGFVELEMKAAGLLDFGTDLNNPNFAQMGTAIGMLGIRVEDPTKLEAALIKILAHDGPAILDVVVNRMELAMPPKITREQLEGFSLYLTKAIINGRGNQVVELIKTNLWR